MKQSLPFLMFLVGVYYFLQAIGGNPGLHSQILQKYLKEVLKMSPTDMSLFGAALIIPWTIKPLYGMLSDFFPILGYRRKSYFIFSGILGWSAYFTLSQIGLNQETLKIGLVLAGISFAFADVLCDAVMVEKGQPLNATDRLQSTQWAALGLAGVLIAYWKGQIAEHWTLQEALWLVAIPPLLVIGFTALALKEEKSAVSWEMLKSTGHDIKNTVKNSWLILGLNALVIGMLWQWNHHPEYAKAMPQVALFANCITPIILFISRSFWVMAFLIVFGSLAYTLAKSEGANDETPQNAWQGLKKGLKSKVLWGTAIFLFLFNCNPNLGTVFYFYEKDVLKFSDELIGKIDMVGSIGFIIGALLYSAISKYFSHRWLLIAIIVTGVAGNLSYLWFESAYKHVYIGG